MSERETLIADFLRDSGWGAAAKEEIAGDASGRRYARLVRQGGETAILMDAPPETGEDVRPFLAIAGHLLSLDLSAPRVLAEDAAAGFLLLEDFGNGLFAQLITADRTRERPLYLAAADTLAALHRSPPPAGLVRFTPAEMADLVRVLFDWYATAIPADGAEDVVERLRSILERAAPEPTVLALRDFHAENLVWLPGREGVRRVGLLDFQDAVIAHPAYDLVSLLHDARRDVSKQTRRATLRHYLDLTGHAERSFEAAAAALSVQRNLRILGVFARLARRDGKIGYLRLLPRVWRLMLRELDHGDLAELREAILGVVPPPGAVFRQETPCATPSP